MTTIAYHHKTRVIAYDSRITCRDEIFDDDTEKLIERDGRKFILSGNGFDIAKAIHAFPESVEIESNPYGFMVEGDVVYWVAWNDGLVETLPINHNQSAGSGEAHAITAMDLGYDAVTAIEMAIKRDTGTGGKIRCLKLE